MDAYEIKEYLLNDIDKVVELLTELNFHNIDVKSNEIRCGLDDDSNPTSVRIKLNNSLSTTIFSRNFKGDIINLVSYLKRIEFIEALSYIYSFLGFQKNNNIYTENKKYKIFEGFFDKIKKDNISDIELPKYDDYILNDYDRSSNLRFLRDGISLKAQRYFQVGFDINTQRIIVPWREGKENGKIIGIMGRYNGDDYEEIGIAKWFPIISFPKSLSLFGYSQNFDYLRNKYIFVFESEKSPMQCYSFRNPIRNCVAVGCHNIESYQLKLLQMLQPKGIILAFDEGLGENETPSRTYEEVIIPICNNIKSTNSLMRYKVGYIYDKENKYLPKGSKASPSDLGEEVFKNLCKECVYWI